VELVVTDRYSQIEIVPDEELEHPPPDNMDAVVAFSGGADCCYTAWRYTKPKNERLPYSLLQVCLYMVMIFQRTLSKLSIVHSRKPELSWIAWDDSDTHGN